MLLLSSQFIVDLG